MKRVAKRKPTILQMPEPAKLYDVVPAAENRQTLKIAIGGDVFSVGFNARIDRLIEREPEKRDRPAEVVSLPVRGV